VTFVAAGAPGRCRDAELVTISRCARLLSIDARSILREVERGRVPVRGVRTRDQARLLVVEEVADVFAATPASRAAVLIARDRIEQTLAELQAERERLRAERESVARARRALWGIGVERAPRAS
jgi:hypothetical protein